MNLLFSFARVRFSTAPLYRSIQDRDIYLAKDGEVEDDPVVIGSDDAADDGAGGCWFAGVDGSLGKLDSSGAVELIHLPGPDPGRPIRIEVSSPSSAWLLTDTGTWRVQVQPRG